MVNKKVRRRSDTQAILGRIREAIRAGDFDSDAEVAQRLGVGRATMSEWFTKEALPHASVFVRMPPVLKVSLHWLFTGDGPRTPPGEHDPGEALVHGAQVELARLEEWLEGERAYWRRPTRNGSPATGAELAERDEAVGRLRPGQKRSHRSA